MVELNSLDPESGSVGPRVGSVASAVAILRHLATHPDGAGVVAIARDLGLSPSSCFNVLRTLAAEEFVEFDPKTKIYSLGIGAHVIGRAALDPRAAFHGMRPRLEALADKFRVTAALLGLRRNDRFVIIGFTYCADAATHIHLTVGHRLPLLIGAAGRCAAAAFEFDDAVLERLLRKVEWATEPTLEEYKASLAFNRTHGWAVDRDGFLNGVTTVAAPVLDQQGRLQFCVSCSTFSGQHSEDEMLALGEAVAVEARWLSRQLFPLLPAKETSAARVERSRKTKAKGHRR